MAVGIVVLALLGLFGVMPYTYHAIQEDSVRIEAASAAQRYMDQVRIAVQAGNPIPAQQRTYLQLGKSFVTGQANDAQAALDLSAQCAQPDGPGTSLFDCTVTDILTVDGTPRTLEPLESFIARQLP